MPVSAPIAAAAVVAASAIEAPARPKIRRLVVFGGSPAA
jgi:hypothetical protein